MATFALQATPERPFVTEQMQKIYQALHADDSMYEIIRLRKWFIQDLESIHNRSITVTRTTAAFEDKKILNRVIMALPPRETIMSLVRHTLAYDYDEPEERGPGQTYLSDIKGVYAVSMGIANRRGAFLTVDELEEVIKCLEDYEEGLSVCWDPKNEAWRQNLPPRGLDLKKHIGQVDMQCSNGEYNTEAKGPYWHTACDGIQGMIKHLTKYAEEARRRGHTGYLEQSPIMVGCSATSMYERCREHHPELCTLSNTTATWGLFCFSVAKIGLKPAVVSVPIIATVEREELPIAEMLVTELAQSLVTQTGFNIVEGGGQADNSAPHEIKKSREYVYVREPWLKLHATKVMERTAMYLDGLQAVADIFEASERADEWTKEVADLKEQLEDLQRAIESAEGGVNAVLEEVERMRGLEERAQAAEDWFALQLAIADTLEITNQLTEGQWELEDEEGEDEEWEDEEDEDEELDEESEDEESEQLE